MSVIAWFMLGSAICGGARDGATLIAGRTIQGLGSGGIVQAFDIIVSDLVPLRYRGNYVAIILLIYSIGATMGAFIGGAIVDHTIWRWAFYIKLPVGAVSLLIMFFFLNVNHRSYMSMVNRLKRIDFIGNFILIGGTTSMLIALTYAGTRYAWSSWHTLLSLLIGFASFPVFGAFEASQFASAEPVMPKRLLSNRTSIIVGINTFLFNVITYWAIFFLPVYFQSVKLTSPTRAGINVIPIALLGVPAAAAAAAAVSRWGKYRIIHILGFTIFTVGLALFAQLDEYSPTGEWVGNMFTSPLGAGMLLNTQLPAFQAPVSEADQAAAKGCWNFIKTLGSVWGVAIPAAIFANRVNELIAGGAVSNPVAAQMMIGGGAYRYASAEFVRRFTAPDQAEIVAVYRLAFQRVFLVAIAFSGFALLLCFFKKDIVLRVNLVTEYGLEEEEKEGSKSNKSMREEGEASNTV
ncbi:MAG: hypothetical protein M1831_000970 [Alyxoria varia]|nr:MAG: hypothetical protein M1831_000970 [Alyxoria varia]